MRKVAVTGGLASGKTTVCHLLKEQGAYVVDADALVHSLLVLESTIGQQVVNLLGSGIIVNHQIDRKKISDVVFSNPEKLKKLEAILHPAVRREINRLFEAVKEGSYRFFVAEVPLLYEAGMETDFDATIFVTCDELLARSRYPNPQEFDRRSRHLLPLSMKSSRATYTLSNSGDRAALQKQIENLIPKLEGE